MSKPMPQQSFPTYGRGAAVMPGYVFDATIGIARPGKGQRKRMKLEAGARQWGGQQQPATKAASKTYDA